MRSTRYLDFIGLLWQKTISLERLTEMEAEIPQLLAELERVLPAWELDINRHMMIHLVQVSYIRVSIESCDAMQCNAMQCNAMPGQPKLPHGCIDCRTVFCGCAHGSTLSSTEYAAFSGLTLLQIADRKVVTWLPRYNRVAVVKACMSCRVSGRMGHVGHGLCLAGSGYGTS